jgi:hypothetical protein
MLAQWRGESLFFVDAFEQHAEMDRQYGWD